jgi:STAM-binding protein
VQADGECADRERSERDERELAQGTRRNGGKRRLRTVLLPHATLPRFLANVSVKTSQNLETCGLLLGRRWLRASSVAGSFSFSTFVFLSSAFSSSSAYRRQRLSLAGLNPAKNAKTLYVVETLLIPKQYAMSDTCTMNEEEGVMLFAEERGLIMLGWLSDAFRISVFARCGM